MLIKFLFCAFFFVVGLLVAAANYKDKKQFPVVHVVHRHCW
jgi:hypothetical protein